MQEQITNFAADVADWFGTFIPPIFPSLGGNARTGVCVVGAGVSGLSAAYMLVKAGRKVIVLDSGPLGGAATGHWTVPLTVAMDPRIDCFEQVYGADAARTIVQSHRAAIAAMEEIIRVENIECDFRRIEGYRILGDDAGERALDEELAAAHRADVPGISKVPHIPAAELDLGSALRFPDQAQLQLLKYLAGLASAIVLGGGRIYTDSRVVRVDGGSPCTVETDNGRVITADAVCVCTNASIGGADDEHAPTTSGRSFAIAATVPHGSVPAALYCDTSEPCHSVWLHPLVAPQTKRRKKPAALDALIVKQDDAAGDASRDALERWRHLESWLYRRWPQASEVIHRWSDRIFVPSDPAARVGPHPGGAANVYVGTDGIGRGPVHGTISGMLLSDLVCGRDNALRPIYEFSRR